MKFCFGHKLRGQAVYKNTEFFVGFTNIFVQKILVMSGKIHNFFALFFFGKASQNVPLFCKTIINLFQKEKNYLDCFDDYDDVRQLQKANVIFRELYGQYLNLPNALLSKCNISYEKIKHQKISGNTKNEMVIQVSHILDSLHIEHVVYYRLFNGACDVHIAILDKLKSVGIRVLNSTCYTVSRPYRMIGSVSVHNDLIEACGWILVVVPFFQWELQQTLQDKQKYLMDKLLVVGFEESGSQMEETNESMIFW
eukprot:TRINITY_DN9599_c0_g1_i4.p1 TRINITY_DN9599_c0_g1~~TRINITY_DN9599_c0_g1_i4.p1  ORF type:complete len:253 (+),score=27.02 TRINITY_DN9599_c0_g1_i4:669-1427(+)